jgi:hypothetical protein
MKERVRETSTVARLAREKTQPVAENAAGSTAAPAASAAVAGGGQAHCTRASGESAGEGL